MPLFCHRCGTGLSGSARFCTNCGMAINATQPMTGKPLTRPRLGRHIAGVCIGVAQTYGWDVALVRILTVICFFFSAGLVAIAYLAGWIGIPEEPFPVPTEYPPSV